MQTTLTSQTPAVVYLASLLDCGRAISITRQHVYPVFSVSVRVRGERNQLGARRDGSIPDAFTHVRRFWNQET